jgi:predicted transcriptional regulator of viral defense system
MRKANSCSASALRGKPLHHRPRSVGFASLLPLSLQRYGAAPDDYPTGHTGYVIVPRQRPSRTIAGVKYRFVYANPRAFWGWEPIWATAQEQVQVSDLEKTLLDCATR